MPKCKILDKKTNQIIEGLDFGGPDIYDINGTLVYAPEGSTSISISNNTINLDPLGLNITDVVAPWEIISQQNINTCNWRVTVQNSLTGEIKSGVYPFNLDGHVYQLECSGEWVMASCGGYKIQTGSGDLCYTLLGTGETIYKNTSTFKWAISGALAIKPVSPEDFAIGYWDDVDPGAYPGQTFLTLSQSFKDKFTQTVNDDPDLSNEGIASEAFRIAEIAHQGSSPQIKTTESFDRFEQMYDHFNYINNPVIISEDEVYKNISDVTDDIYGFKNDYISGKGHITYQVVKNAIQNNGIVAGSLNTLVNVPSTLDDLYANYNPVRISSQKVDKIFLNFTQYFSNANCSEGWINTIYKQVVSAEIKYIEVTVLNN